MADLSHPYQPGAILHDAVRGAFKAHGWSFEGWLKENGIKPATARGVTFGQSKGPAGQALLSRIIEGAGADLVHAGYVSRLLRHVDDVRRLPRRVYGGQALQDSERRA